ncbi:MAG: NUDIX hydrolase [Candidatus Cloacimonetes bacterium]|nr:NUDIX hydrolase [Candidatus Cloacimonadota bacterium]MCF7813966.1 NUDIX hydrolase [Candidatus Cloacimonadota bacterium]MCF7868810.1 NUDIX hydrolase [Candidatus Cloacimonadota bacterium]MCF7884069.1 NUDIX hydrolase [Candidatus Cloacimonadota bacterium]
MNYMMELRQKVGKMPLIMVGSTVIIKNKQGEILLQKRADTGLWSTIGGAMEIGESFEETAIREVEEETSLKIKNLELKGILAGKDMYHTYPNGDEINLATAVYEVTDWAGIPKVNDHESLDFKFFELNDLPEMDPLAIKILEKSGYLIEK